MFRFSQLVLMNSQELRTIDPKMKLQFLIMDVLIPSRIEPFTGPLYFTILCPLDCELSLAKGTQECSAQHLYSLFPPTQASASKHLTPPLRVTLSPTKDHFLFLSTVTSTCLRICLSSHRTVCPLPLPRTRTRTRTKI